MSKSTNSDDTLRERLSESAHESMEQVGRAAGKARERLSHEAEAAKAHARDVGHKAKERSEETVHFINDFVEDNPWTAVGIAFAAGTLVSFLRKR